MHLTFVGIAIGLGFLLDVTQGHYVYPGLISNGGQRTPAWTYVRETVDRFNKSPVQGVTGVNIRCNEDPSRIVASTLTVQAGTTVGFWMDSGISHPGPVLFYLAKVPSGKTAATWDGSGAVWFKVSEDHPKMAPYQITWPSTGVSTPSVNLPKALPSGEYLMRVEQIALHGAYTLNGAQFYLACGQLNVTGGGNGTPGPLVSFPGAYSATDPGILFDMYSNPTSYTPPGPKVWSG